MKALALLSLGWALGTVPQPTISVDSPPIQVGPGDTTGDSPACAPSAAEWHDLMAESHTVVEGLLGDSNPNVGILFAQETEAGPWTLYMVKPDGTACLLISGPASKTLRGDEMDPGDVAPAEKD